MSRSTRYVALDKPQRQQLCEFIHYYVDIAGSSGHQFRPFARWQISLLLWRWTADAYCSETSKVRSDAIKYDQRLVPATEAAIKKLKVSNKGLIHEHCVPRMFLADRIIKRRLSSNEIYELLAQHCKAVIVTREEDKKLSMYGRKSMLGNWDWGTGCPYQRYRDANIFQCIVWGNVKPPPEISG